MTPVEVWLLLQEGVIVILAGDLVPFPSRAAEIADPIVGRSTIGRRIVPDVPISFRIIARRAALDKQGCRSDVWLGTKSSRILSPRRWAWASRSSKSASVPKRGSTPQ